MRIDDRELAARIERLDRLAFNLDSRFRIPWIGIRFGWDALIGLVPVAGDIVTGAMAGRILLEARRIGVPAPTLARMATHVLLDLLLGAIPVAGTVIDVLYRANDINLGLLLEHVAQAGRGPKSARNS